jgi:hypothetical protein
LAVVNSPGAHLDPPAVDPRRTPAKLTLLPLVIATFFMVSGGTYGTEEIVHGAGYGSAMLVLLITPLLWSLPTALMIGELASAIPAEGGFYVWVRDAMGRFWGFQEAWLSLVASIFDMAIYPTLFVAYLVRLFPWFDIGYRGLLVGVVVVATCAALNLAGIRVVAMTSVWLFVLLSAPFLVITALAVLKPGSLAAITHPTMSHIHIVGALLVAMWNYMGWDNASTIAGEVAQPRDACGRGAGGVELHHPGCGHVADEAESRSMGDGIVGRHCRVAGRPGAARGVSRWRDDERLWHVQRSGAELFPPAIRDGTGWDAAAGIRETYAQHWCAVGIRRSARDRVGVVSGLGIRAAGDD